MNVSMFGHKRIPSRDGGIEVVVGELSTRMAALGHRVICYNRSVGRASGVKPEASTMPPNVISKTVWTVDKKGLAAVTSSFFAAICASFDGTQVVHIHAEGPAFMCWLPKLFGKRVIVTIHGLDWQRAKWKNGLGAKYIRTGERMAVRFADEIIVLSRNIQDYFAVTYGRNTVWIPNGVVKPEYVPVGEIYNRYGLKKDEYILFLGRLVPEKGIHYLIEAFSKVTTDKKLVIAGGTSDTDAYVSYLENIAGGNEQIRFIGFVQGRVLEELYSNAYIYVLPSDVEGMPMSLLEAMSYGNCCLVSDIPEIAEVVEDRAEVFTRGNVEALTSALQKLCDNPSTVETYRRLSQSFICEKYNWNDVTKRTLELYQ